MRFAVALKLSVPVNWKLAEALELGFVGWFEIDVFGAMESAMFHVWVAGLASMFPAWSIARTSKVCEPAPGSAYVFGLVHAANAAVSRRHWKVSAPVGEWLSLPVKLKLIEPASATFVIVVFGAVPSTTFHV